MRKVIAIALMLCIGFVVGCGDSKPKEKAKDAPKVEKKDDKGGEKK